MTSELEIEAGKESVSGHCSTCGHESRIFRGLVYNDGYAYAVYVGSYMHCHPEYGVSLAVSIGGWGEGADTTLRECIALEWRIGETGPGCVVIDAASSSWASEHTLGRMLTRQESLASGRAKEAFAVSDAVWGSDVRLSGALLPNGL